MGTRPRRWRGFPAIILLTAISERHQTLLHVVCRDITEQKQAQARAEYLAYYDALTGLPNRLLGLPFKGYALSALLPHPSCAP